MILEDLFTLSLSIRFITHTIYIRNGLEPQNGIMIQVFDSNSPRKISYACHVSFSYSSFCTGCHGSGALPPSFLSLSLAAGAWESDFTISTVNLVGGRSAEEGSFHLAWVYPLFSCHQNWKRRQKAFCCRVFAHKQPWLLSQTLLCSFQWRMEWATKCNTLSVCTAHYQFVFIQYSHHLLTWKISPFGAYVL